jgi:cyclopropane-fatty-acyl-phospholipid synthase
MRASERQRRLRGRTQWRSGQQRPAWPGNAVTAARQLGPLLRALLGPTLPVRVEFWDGSAVEADTADDRSPGTVRINSPDAIRRILWGPDELGLGRAYVVGDLDAEGDIVAMVAALRDALPTGLRLRAKAAVEAIAAARRAGVIGRPLPPPPQEAG